MRILIVEVNWLGDVLFSTPAIKALKQKFPAASISCLCVPRVKEVLDLNPAVDEIIINDEEASHKGFLGRIKLANELRKRKFDLAVLFHRSATRAAITWLAGIPWRVGYGRRKQRFFLTDPLPMPKKDSLHRVDYYLGIVKGLGCDIGDRAYEFFTSGQDREFIADFLKKEGVVPGDFAVCLNPGGNWGPKRWPKENFSRLADALIKEHRGKVIFTGSKDDLELIREIRGKMKNQPIVACGRTNLKQLACLFQKASLMISGDSGPLHIAASQGACVIALFGPTSAAITGPIGRGRIEVIQKVSSCPVPCYDSACYDNVCMRDITVEDVLERVKLFI